MKLYQLRKGLIRPPSSVSASAAALSASLAIAISGVSPVPASSAYHSARSNGASAAFADSACKTLTLS